MSREEPLSVYRRRLRERMQGLRAQHNLTQLQVADSLQVMLDTYKKWERRGALPLDHVERLANLYGVSIKFMVTGRQAADSVPLPEPSAKSARRRSA